MVRKRSRRVLESFVAVEYPNSVVADVSASNSADLSRGQLLVLVESVVYALEALRVAAVARQLWMHDIN